MESELIQQPQSLTGNFDVDKILLTHLPLPSFTAMAMITKQHQKITNNQMFWRQRLEERLQLYSDDLTLDYKSICKFLDNDKTFIENYMSAKRKKLSNITKLLLDNNKIYQNKPGTLLKLDIMINDFNIIKSGTFEQLLERVIKQHNHHLYPYESNINHSYFDEKTYGGDEIAIAMPVFLTDYGNKGKDYKFVALRKKGGFTNGELLIEIAKHIPNKEEVKQHHINIIKNHHQEIIDRLEQRRAYLLKLIEVEKKVGRDYHEFVYLNKHYSLETMQKLLTTPEQFLCYINIHPTSYFNNSLLKDVFGGADFFDGLTLYNEIYVATFS